MTEPVVFKPPARLDAVNAPLFEQELAARLPAGSEFVVLDFADVEYVSSAGLRVLLIAAKRLKSADGRIALCGVSDSCRNVLEVSGFIKMLPLYSSVEEAVAA